MKNKILTIITLIFLIPTLSFAQSLKAKRIRTDTTNFDNLLSGSDDNAQKAFDTLDNVTAANITCLGSDETIDQFLTETVPSGVLHTITISDDGGLDFSWSAGEAHVNGVVIETDAGSATAADNDRTYLYATVPTGSTLQTSTTYPTGDYALVATIDTYGGDIRHFYQRNTVGECCEDIETHIELVHADIISSGLLVAADTDVTNANDFTIASGTYYHEGLDRHDIASTLYSAGADHTTNNTTRYYHSGGSWTTEATLGIDFSYYDNGTNKTAVTVGKWYAGWIFIVKQSLIEYVYPQQQHVKEQDALQEAITYPPYHSEFAVPLAKFIFRGGETAFDNRAYFADIRPVHIKGVAGEIVYAVQDLWKTIQADTGSTSANLTYDTLTLSGTANQVITSITGDIVTFSTPQDLHSGASPTFDDLTLSSPSSIYGLSHNSFADYVANEHIDWTSTSDSLDTSGTIKTSYYLMTDYVYEQAGSYTMMYWDSIYSHPNFTSNGIILDYSYDSSGTTMMYYSSYIYPQTDMDFGGSYNIYGAYSISSNYYYDAATSYTMMEWNSNYYHPSFTQSGIIFDYVYDSSGNSLFYIDASYMYMQTDLSFDGSHSLYGMYNLVLPTSPGSGSSDGEIYWDSGSDYLYVWDSGESRYKYVQLSGHKTVNKVADLEDGEDLLGRIAALEEEVKELRGMIEAKI